MNDMSVIVGGFDFALSGLRAAFASYEGLRPSLTDVVLSRLFMHDQPQPMIVIHVIDTMMRGFTMRAKLRIGCDGKDTTAPQGKTVIGIG